MPSGLLWYDASKRPINEKITDAARRYVQKFGVTPDTCFVNPADAPIATDAPDRADSNGIRIAVKPKQTIMLNYFWLGVSNPAPQPAADATAVSL